MLIDGAADGCYFLVYDTLNNIEFLHRNLRYLNQIHEDINVLIRDQFDCPPQHYHPCHSALRVYLRWHLQLAQPTHP